MCRTWRPLAAVLWLGIAGLPVEAAAQDARIGSFQYSASTDPISDADRSFIFTTDEDQEVAIGWKCFSDGLNFLVLVSDPMLRLRLISVQDRAYVTYRFDKDEPVGPEIWKLNEENNVAYAPMARVGAITESARRARQLVVRIFEDDGSHVTTKTFDLSGFTQAIARLPCAR